ncbi:hypothetical protein [Bradyrhizobium japonicum]|uniref:hypothetical protein n=1 Tax=Bradyrhizobium japonicum TaxID=375 RepID=UPI000426CDD0|nr:hypothetical protein [Bradyrhizobium japonicum]
MRQVSLGQPIGQSDQAFKDWAREALREIEIASNEHSGEGEEAVSGSAGTTTPLVNSGSGTVGTGARWSREDHVHPADTATADARIDARAIRYDAAQSLTSGQKAQARENINASLTKQNKVVNGGMQVSQENGTTAGTTNGYFPVDQFFVGAVSGGAFSAAQVASVTPAGSPNRLRFTITTADASVAAGDIAYIVQYIEGLRVADLLFGSASAKETTVQFGVRAPAGTYCFSIRNAASNRSYVAEFTIAVSEANTDVLKQITIPGDVTGTWLKDTGQGLVLTWCLMGGTTYQGAGSSWQASSLVATSNQFNLFGTVGNVFELFDVGLYEGATAPSFQLPEYASELALCQRYFVPIATNAIFGGGTLRTGGTSGYGVVALPVPMRILPTIGTSGVQIICGDTLVNVSSLSVSAGVGGTIALVPVSGSSAGSVGQAFVFYQASGQNAFNARM